jgi:hypothetical protein
MKCTYTAVGESDLDELGEPVLLERKRWIPRESNVSIAISGERSVAEP